MVNCCKCKVDVVQKTTDASKCAVWNCCNCWKEKIGWSGYEYDEGACRQCKARSPEGVAAAAKAVADKAAADKAASEKAAAERAAAAKAAAEQAAREREAKAAAAKAAAQKAAAQKAATEKALLEKDLVPWFCAVGFHPADAFDLAMILLRNGVRVPGSALAQTDEHICRLLYQAGLPDGLAVQVPLLLEALRSVRASRSAVAATINPGQDVGDWLRADVGLDDVSATEIEAVFKADGVEMDSVGVILAQEEGEIEELVASLPVGVRLPLLEALRDVRAGRLKPRPDPASTRAVLEVVWCVTEEVAPWLTALPTMTPKGVSAVEAACHARGIRTKGCLLAQRSPALSEIMTQLPKGPQKPLQDAIRSARKAGLGWNVSGTPRDASAFEPTATLTTFQAARGNVEEQARGRFMNIARVGKEMEKGQRFQQATKEEGKEASCFCFASVRTVLVPDSDNTRCVRCGEDTSRHVGPSKCCFDSKDFECKTCGGYESVHAMTSAGKMCCSKGCTHCGKVAASHSTARKVCEATCVLCAKGETAHHGTGRTCMGEEDAFVAAQLFAVDHLRDAGLLRGGSLEGSREGSPTPPRLPGQADEEEEEEEGEALSEVHKLLAAAAAELLGRLGPEAASVDAASDKFQTEAKSLVFGKPAQAALGVAHFMFVDPLILNAKLSRGLEGIIAEFEEFGTEEDKECLRYVLEKEAGSSAISFQAGLRRDCDDAGKVLPERCVPADPSAPSGTRGMRFEDFCKHTHSEIARLAPHHVAALRLYTTAAYKSINSPLRAQNPHNLPVTVAFIQEAVKQLRAVQANAESSAQQGEVLWRGMKDVKVPAEFMRKGGTELAPMSTTTDLATAMIYSASSSSVLLCLRTNHYMKRGADISFLSAFPAEKEFLFPPLTFLHPVNDAPEVVTLGARTFFVIDVEPVLP